MAASLVSLPRLSGSVDTSSLALGEGLRSLQKIDLPFAIYDPGDAIDEGYTLDLSLDRVVYRRAGALPRPEPLRLGR